MIPLGRGNPFEVSDLGERSAILQMSLEERSFESVMVGELEISFIGVGVGVGVGVPPIAPGGSPMAVGVGEGFEVGLVTITPLLHTNFFPDLIHV